MNIRLLNSSSFKEHKYGERLLSMLCSIDVYTRTKDRLIIPTSSRINFKSPEIQVFNTILQKLSMSGESLIIVNLKK